MTPFLLAAAMDGIDPYHNWNYFTMFYINKKRWKNLKKP